jgi:DNA helicase-2/ATP-dependent DNA helicase PcrA
MEYLTSEQILEPLNPQQRQAAAHINGALLILAGPGSGKTRVITHRIANMVAQGIDPRNIVALTFTNKAAEEMKKRINTLSPAATVWTSTFHRFCSRMLRQYASLVGIQENFTIYDAGDSKKIMKQAIESVAMNLKHYTADALANAIGKVKNNAITVEQFRPRVGHPLDAIVAKVYPEYQRRLKMANAVDFDDLLLYAVDLLRNSPELRQALDTRFEYMMVDEYQDTNLAQYQLIRLLNHECANLAVTGDPDQSIYGWRGANINNILQFEVDFGDAQVVRLEENYRSTPEILTVADQLIQNNTKRKQKSLYTHKDPGAQVRMVTYPSPKDESSDIADTIALAVAQGEREPNDFAILYRANYLSRSLEIALNAVGLPYQIVNGTEFYQRKEIKDLLGYLYLLNNPNDTVAFERIVNVPPRKIGKVTVNRLRAHAESNGLPMLEAARQIEKVEAIKKSPSAKISQFVDMIDRLTEAIHEPVSGILNKVLTETGYREWLEINDGQDEVDRVGNVDELVVATEEFDREFHEDANALEAYLERSALVAATDVWDNDSNRVSLMTLHAAKGLEFPSVLIVGLEDGILPHERSSKDDDQLEEERRLFFVGITRAQQHLQISRCQNRFRKGSYWPSIPSRFLMELPRHEMQIFEPAKPSYGGRSMVDDISNVSPWDDDLPSIDINDVPDVQVYRSDNGGSSGNESGSDNKDDLGGNRDGAADQVHEAVADVEYKLSIMRGEKEHAEKPTPKMGASGFPRLMTAAEMEAKRPTDIRLHPDKHEVGMVVSHDDYGVGTIVEMTGSGAKKTATIEFEESGRKSFRLAYVNLQIV